ncbi:heme o synthase [bacterium]|nr:heme o synthase [bacterium]
MKQGEQVLETPVAPLQWVGQRISAYISLTKPTIMLLVVLTGAAGLVLQGGLADHPFRFALTLFFLGMAGGSANAFNQYFERDRDAIMRRTRKRRALPMGRITPAEAFVFSFVLAVASTLGFWFLFNPLSAMLSLGTIVYYALFYTLYLKPRTPENIVIGGVAGSMGPVITWAAASGTMAIEPWLMFAVIFFWTPPHFWALAVYMKDDYVDVGYPMLPVVKGQRVTWNRSIVYAIITLATSIALLGFGTGWLYAAAAVGLGGWFLRRLLHARREESVLAARGAFTTSIVYLLALFTALILDKSILG